MSLTPRTTSHNDSSNQNLGLDAAGCITLLIFLPPLIISICFPGLKVNLPSRFRARFSADAALVGQPRVSAASERVTSRAAGYVELPRQAACSTCRRGRNGRLCLRAAAARSQVVFHYRRTEVNKLERTVKVVGRLWSGGWKKKP